MPTQQQSPNNPHRKSLLSVQNCMTKDVVAQLQKISTQQSKIKTLKGKLAVYLDVAILY